MHSIQKTAIVAIAIAAITISTELQEIQADSSLRSDDNWQQLEPGLEFGVFVAPQVAESGDSFEFYGLILNLLNFGF